MKRRTFLASAAAAALMPAPSRALFYKMKGGRAVPLGDGTPSGGIPGIYKSRLIPRTGRPSGIPPPFGSRTPEGDDDA